MNLRRKIRHSNQRWNIPLNEKEEFEKFRNRVLIALDQTLGQYILQHPEVSREFAFQIGYPQAPSSVTGDAALLELVMAGRYFKDDNVYKAVAGAPDQRKLVAAVQTLFWVLEENRCPRITEFAESIQ